MNKLVSVVVPVYNVKGYVRKCVDSLLAQTYENFEIILIDDGSTDGSSAICDKYAKSHKNIRTYHFENKGLSTARNRGILKSKGDLITFVDSDDFVEKDYIEVLTQVLEEFGADMAIGGDRVLYDSGKVIERATGERYKADASTALKRMLYHDGIDTSAWAKLYKKELFDGVRYPEGMNYEDIGTTYKLMHASKVIAVNSKPIYNYIIRRDSISNNEFTEKKYDLVIETDEMAKDVSRWYPELKQACLRRQMFANLSTLSQLANSRKKYPKIQKKLMDFVNEHRAEVLKDERTPRRDKMALRLTKFGFGVYKMAWRTYLKLTERV